MKKYLALLGVAASLLVFLFCVGRSVYATDKNTARKVAMKTALELLEKKDTLAAVEFVAKQGDPLRAVQMFGELTEAMYWDKKNLAASVAMGRAGVQFGLTEAIRYESKQPDLAKKLQLATAGISYNLASFTWPGWDEKGIPITSADISVGLDAAKTNLRLTKELKRSPLEMSRANWIIGAQELASGMHDAAIVSFNAAASEARKVKSRPDELLGTGFAQMTELLDNPENAAVKAKLGATKQDLSKEKDGADFIGQIDTAYKVFGVKAVK